MLRKIGTVIGGRTGQPFEVWWFSLPGAARGHYEVRRPNHKVPIDPRQKEANDEEHAIEKAKNDVTDL
ncbi:MAG: hypothetical protein SAK29_42540 [Scytonema sp. PMC 1069.18]|nr:hypothetical protein [Scytonema sp. PMC 1069.18]